jgi:hypothetical protein
MADSFFKSDILGRPPFYFKDPKMEKGIRARRIGSPKNKNLFGHDSCVHDF